MLLRLIKLPFLLALVLIIQSCGEDEKIENNLSNAKVSVEKVKTDSVTSVVQISGNIEGIQKVKLSTKVMGTISYLPYDVGARVKKGDILVKINSGDLLAKQQQIESGIAQAEAAFTNIRINYERVKNLFASNSATKKEMEDIQLAYDMAKARVEQARAMKNEIKDVLNYSVIRSPFDGFIVNKFFEQGDIAAPGHPILIVENLDDFKIVASVSASDINKLSVGQKVKIFVEEINQEYKGIVDKINPSAHPASRQYEVQVKFDQIEKHNNLLKSGMYAKINLENISEMKICVDENFLIKKGQLVGVYTVSTNNEALLRWLRLGRKIEGKYEVLSGLNENDLIITNPQNVAEGQKLEVL